MVTLNPLDTYWVTWSINTTVAKHYVEHGTMHWTGILFLLALRCAQYSSHSNNVFTESLSTPKNSARYLPISLGNQLIVYNFGGPEVFVRLASRWNSLTMMMMMNSQQKRCTHYQTKNMFHITLPYHSEHLPTHNESQPTIYIGFYIRSAAPDFHRTTPIS